MPCDVSNLYLDVQSAPADAQSIVILAAAQTSTLQEGSGSSWISDGVGTLRGSYDSSAVFPLSQNGAPRQSVHLSSFEVDFTRTRLSEAAVDSQARRGS